MFARNWSLSGLMLFSLWAVDAYQPVSAPWNNTWLHDLTPRSSLENTIGANREVWVVAILHNESSACQDKAAMLVNLSKALSGIARVGIVMCDTTCVEGCCKGSSMGERLGSKQYPSLHAVFPWSADKVSRPIPGLDGLPMEGLSTAVIDVSTAGQAQWKAKPIATWLSSRVPYSGKILRTETEMIDYYETPLIPKLLLISGKKGVPLMFKLLRYAACTLPVSTAA